MRTMMVWMTVVLLGVTIAAQGDDAPAFKGDPYTLNTCPVGGDELGSMGEPVPFVHEGRQVKFCCSGCEPRFKADPAKYITKIDAAMIADQKPHYPLTSDIVSGEALPADDKVLDVVYMNRLVRFGSQKSAQTFMKDPDTYIAKLNEATIAKQLPNYKLDKCLVSGEPLDAMGEPVQKVYANRLAQFCCDHCAADFEASPAKFIALLDKGEAPAESAEHKAKHDEHHN